MWNPLCEPFHPIQVRVDIPSDHLIFTLESTEQSFMENATAFSPEMV